MSGWSLSALDIVPSEEVKKPLPLIVGRELLSESGLKIGDVIYVRCVGGFIMEVDSITGKTTDRAQQFRLVYRDVSR